MSCLRPSPNTRWPIRFIPRFCWHQSKDCVLIFAPHTKTQLLFWFHQHVGINLIGNPVQCNVIVLQEVEHDMQNIRLHPNMTFAQNFCQPMSSMAAPWIEIGKAKAAFDFSPSPLTAACIFAAGRETRPKWHFFWWMKFFRAFCGGGTVRSGCEVSMRKREYTTIWIVRARAPPFQDHKRY